MAHEYSRQINRLSGSPYRAPVEELTGNEVHKTQRHTGQVLKLDSGRTD